MRLGFLTWVTGIRGARPTFRLHLPPRRTPRREEIEAAIAIRNAADREPLLPPDAMRLLAVMFRRSSVCQRGVADLAAEGFNQRRLLRLLGILAEAGLLSKERGTRVPNIYRLHLPPQRQP